MHYDLANTLVKTDQIKQAILHYQRAIDLTKPVKRLEYHFNLGNAYSMCDKYQEAISCYKSAIDSL